MITIGTRSHLTQCLQEGSDLPTIAFSDIPLTITSTKSDGTIWKFLGRECQERSTAVRLWIPGSCNGPFGLIYPVSTRPTTLQQQRLFDAHA